MRRHLAARPCLAAALLAALLACAAPGPAGDAPAPTADAWPDAAGDVADPALAALARDLWTTLLADDPLMAGRLGDRAALPHMPDLSPPAREARHARWLDLAERAAALDPAALRASDAVTLRMARRLVHEQLGWLELELDTWLVDPGHGIHTTLWNLAPDQPVDTEAARDALLQRWIAMPGWVEARRQRLLEGLAEGRVASRRAISSSVEQLDALLAQPTREWTLAQVGAELPADTRGELRAALLPWLDQGLRPTLTRLRATLAEELLPAARPDEQAGLVHLPGGAYAYRRLAELHTGLSATPREIHALGLEQVAAVRDEMLALAQQLFPEQRFTDLAGLQAHVRGDPALFFETREQVQAKAVSALARAEAALDGWFGRRPRADCVVVPIAPHEEAHSTIAYYRRPPADGSGPGRYFINTSEPHTRPRYDAEVLAFHEAVPGHHLQIAIAQELPGVPLFQRNTGTTAFVEGWALYTERLCDEMGLYSGPLDRLGMLSFDAWRACRLVVETGIHALGWSRQEAIDYLAANTLLSANNVVVEVDRYIANPGQALAYKLGQLEILRLRRAARARLGAEFRIDRFHDVVLGAGAVTLDLLAEHVEAWVRAGGPAVSRATRDGTS